MITPYFKAVNFAKEIIEKGLNGSVIRETRRMREFWPTATRGREWLPVVCLWMKIRRDLSVN